MHQSGLVITRYRRASERLPQRGELLDSARGTDGTCRVAGAAGARRHAAAEEKQACRHNSEQETAQLPLEQAVCANASPISEPRQSFTAKWGDGATQSASMAAPVCPLVSPDTVGKQQATPPAESASAKSLPVKAALDECARHAQASPSTGAPSAGRMTSTDTAAAQPDDVQQEPSITTTEACRADGAAAAACLGGAALLSNAAGTHMPARPLTIPAAGAGHNVATVPGLDVSPACFHAAGGVSNQGADVSGELADGGAAASPPGSSQAAACSNHPVEPHVKQRLCRVEQPAPAAAFEAANLSAPSADPAALTQAEDANHQLNQAAPLPVSLQSVGSSRSSGVVASAISALGLGRSATLLGGAQESASLRAPQAKAEPQKPQLCPQQFEAAWFCGPGRNAAAAGALPREETSTRTHSSSTPAAAAAFLAEAGAAPSAVQVDEKAARRASSAAASDRAAQGASLEVGSLPGVP